MKTSPSRVLPILVPALGFTLVELLVVITILSILLGVVVGTPGILSSNRRMGSLQKVAATMDEARSLALRGNGNVFVAFTPADNVSDTATQPCRQFALFQENADGQLIQKGEWLSLAEGVIFDPTTLPANAANASNVYAPTNPQSPPQLHVGGRDPTSMPCLGFGSLGEVVYPVTKGSLVLTVADGHVENGLPVVPNPSSSLSLEVRRNTGKTLINP